MSNDVLSGIKCEAYFITKDVLLTKYYERTNREEWEAEKQREEAENPFGDSADDAFGHDDDDDGFGDFMEDDSDDDDRPLLEKDPYEMEETRAESKDYQVSYSEDVAEEQDEVDILWENEGYDDGYLSSDDQEYEEDEDDWNDW